MRQILPSSDPREIPLRTGKCETTLGLGEAEAGTSPQHRLLPWASTPYPRMLTSDGHLPMPCTPLRVPWAHHLVPKPLDFTGEERGRLREGAFTQDSHNWKTVPVFFPPELLASSMIPTCPRRAHFYFEGSPELEPVNL